MARTLPWILLGFVVATPSAVAQPCVTEVPELCEAAEDFGLARVFGDYADIGLIALGLLATALVLSVLIGLVRWLLRRSAVRKVRIGVAEKVREVEPAGTAKLALDLENPNGRRPVTVLIDPAPPPAGWRAGVRATQERAGRFVLVDEREGPVELRLEGRDRGPHQARVEVTLAAPEALNEGESIEYDVRVVPYRDGYLRRRKAREAVFTLLVTGRIPRVQITDVIHEPLPIHSNAPVTSRAHIVNAGERDAMDVSVQFLLNGAEVDRKVLPHLGPKAETDIEFRWTANPGENHIRVAVQ